jgi:hypothetical protein
MNFSTFATIFLVLAAWIALNRWILPWFGVPTCMSGGCAVRSRVSVEHQAKPAPGTETSGPIKDNAK